MAGDGIEGSSDIEAALPSETGAFVSWPAIFGPRRCEEGLEVTMAEADERRGAEQQPLPSKLRKRLVKYGLDIEKRVCRGSNVDER